MDQEICQLAGVSAKLVSSFQESNVQREQIVCKVHSRVLASLLYIWVGCMCRKVVRQGVRGMKQVIHGADK